MPVRGRPPKENPQDGGKRRKHEAIELGSAPVKRPESLGPRPGGGRWMKETQAYWRMWQRSPQATLFQATDWHALRRAAFLQELLWMGERATEGEIRQIEAKVGATVADRHMLGIKVRAPGSKPVAPEGEKQEPARPKGRDTRRLQVVS